MLYFSNLTVYIHALAIAAEPRGINHYNEYNAVFEVKNGCSGFIISPRFPQPYKGGDSGHYTIQVPHFNVSKTLLYTVI